MAREREPRVLLIGLDGVTWRLLSPWVDAGHLPHLRRLMASGTWGPLTSTIVPQTPPAWTSVVTGVSPGRHGILGFVKRRPGTYEKEYPTSLDRRRDALWEFLGRAGKRSIIFDLPLAYPPDPVHGIMVTGLGTPGTASDFVWPRDLRPTIVDGFGPHELDIHFRGDVLAFVADAVRVTTQRIAVVRHLMAEHPWDFVMVVLTTPDRLQHVVWKYLDDRHPFHDARESATYRDAILEFYRLIDRGVGELATACGEETTVMVASDHGFGPLDTKVSLSRWLTGQGFLVMGRDRWEFSPARSGQIHTVRTGAAGRVLPDGAGLALTVDRPADYAGLVVEVPDAKVTSNYEVRVFVAQATPGARLEIKDVSPPRELQVGGDALNGGPEEVVAVFQPQARPARIMVAMTTYGGNPCGQVAVHRVVITEREDWTRTSAYLLEVGEASESRRIRINLRGREPYGIVAPGAEYDTMRARLADGLRSLADPSTGRRLVSDVLWDEEAFPGPCRHDAADLVVLFADGVGGMSAQGEADDAGPVCHAAVEGFSGRHEPVGVLVLSGSPIRRGTIAARLVDLCPTVLHLLGLPVPEDLDGRVLVDALTSDFQRVHPVRVAPRQPLAERPDTAPYSDEERRQIEARLRRLGYVE